MRKTRILRIRGNKIRLFCILCECLMSHFVRNKTSSPSVDVSMSTISSSLRSEVTLGLDRLVSLYGSGQIVRPEIFSPRPETNSNYEFTFNQAITNTMKIIDKVSYFEPGLKSFPSPSVCNKTFALFRCENLRQPKHSSPM